MAGALATATLGALAIATVSTVGDFIWAAGALRHRAVYGLTHGALLFLCVGAFLGWASGRPAAGALRGAAIGLAAAGTFYVIAPLVGYSAMFVAWFGLWIALAAVHAGLRGVAAPTATTVTRGLLAALASGVAFYLVSGIWRPFDPAGWDYAVHVAAWTAAYFPGFAALFLPIPFSRSTVDTPAGARG
jgi:hypothetical protein